jgi:regulator of cell morphogenesis and NO signaling
MVVIDSKQTVREIVVHSPGAANVLEGKHIDYCDSGDKSLADACSAVGAPVDEVVRELEDAAEESPDAPDAEWLQRPLADLIQHILDVHHVSNRAALAQLRPLAKRVLGAHHDKHPELERVAALFEALDADLVAHLRKEELVLFPFIRDLETLGWGATSPVGPITTPLAIMDEDHDMFGGLLRNLRHATGDYAVPSDGSAEFRTFYESLGTFERDMHRHIHLETNVLFPAALALAAKYGATK